MTLVMTDDPTEFRDRAWQFLESRPECNVLATISLAVFEGRYADFHPLFAYSRDRRGHRRWRRPAHAALLAGHERAGTPARPEQFVDAWLARDPELNGANGPPATAQALAAAWRAQTGGRSSCTREMAMHTLTEVADPPRVPAGRLRAADRGERELLIEWWRAFERRSRPRAR